MIFIFGLAFYLLYSKSLIILDSEKIVFVHWDDKKFQITTQVSVRVTMFEAETNKDPEDFLALYSLCSLV